MGHFGDHNYHGALSAVAGCEADSLIASHDGPISGINVIVSRVLPFLGILRLREDGCVCPGGGGIRKTGQKEAQMRILEKSVRVVRSGVWLAAGACALVVGWQAARGNKE